MSTKLTPTFAVCIAGGLAAGIALARPPQESQAEPVEVAVPQYRDDPAGVDAPVRSEPIEIADFTFNEVAVAAGSVVEVRNSDERRPHGDRGRPIRHRDHRRLERRNLHRPDSTRHLQLLLSHPSCHAGDPDSPVAPDRR